MLVLSAERVVLLASFCEGCAFAKNGDDKLSDGLLFYLPRSALGKWETPGEGFPTLKLSTGQF